MSDERLSIEELRLRIAVMHEGRSPCDLVVEPGSRRVSARADGVEVGEIWFDNQWMAAGAVAVLRAAPALLEIAAAALAWAGSDDEDRQGELDAMLAALSKVRQ